MINTQLSSQRRLGEFFTIDTQNISGIDALFHCRNIPEGKVVAEDIEIYTVGTHLARFFWSYKSVQNRLKWSERFTWVNEEM